MAKRTGKNAKGAKDSKGAETQRLVVIAALERAVSQLRGLLTDKNSRLDEGAYPVCLDVHVAGDVTVGKATPPGPPGKPVTTRTFSDREFAAALWLGLEANERRRAVTNAVKAIARGERGGETIEDASAALADLLFDAAKANQLTETHTPAGSSGRAGAVGGKPSVMVAGTVGEAEVGLEVEAA